MMKTRWGRDWCCYNFYLREAAAMMKHFLVIRTERLWPSVTIYIYIYMYIYKYLYVIIICPESIDTPDTNKSGKLGLDQVWSTQSDPLGWSLPQFGKPTISHPSNHPFWVISHLRNRGIAPNKLQLGGCLIFEHTLQGGAQKLCWLV